MMTEDKRRQVLAKVVARWDRADQLEAFVADSPLIEVQFNPAWLQKGALPASQTVRWCGILPIQLGY